MKNHRDTMKAIAAAALLCAAGFAQAAGSADINVSATVQGICKFQAASADLAFGSLDPSGGVDATASGSIDYKCTNGTAAPTVSFNSGTGSRTMSGGGNTLAYTITLGSTVAGTGFGSGQEKTLTLGGTISAANLENAKAGLYTETVQININP